MKQEEVIQRIKELGEKILPEDASLWLYGSRARGDARPDSDYDCVYEVSKAELADQLAPDKEMIDTIARMVKE